MAHRIQFSRFVSVFAILGLVLTMVLSTPLFGQSVDAAKGGNSENAKRCQKGGWQHLQNSDGIPFSSQGECVASGAHGEGVEAIPSITVSFPSLGGGYCNASATLTGFAANSSFAYEATWGNPDNDIRGGPISGSVSTDGSGTGSIDFSPPIYLISGINDIIYTVDGVTSGSVLATC